MNKDPKEKIENALDIMPAKNDSDNLPVISGEEALIEKPEDHYEEDYRFIRENFYNQLEKGNQALRQMLYVAEASEEPKAYDTVSNLIKTLTGANKDFYEVMEKNRAKIEKATANENSNTATHNQVNNNMFIGSTNEAIELLRRKREGE